MRFFVSFVLLFLVGCTPHATLIEDTDPAEDAVIIPVYTATNRSFDETGVASGRDDALSFTRLDIAVPPDHVTGKIITPRGAPDPRKHFLVAEREDFARRAFQRELSASLSALPVDQRDVLLYVHGFNNTFADGVLRMAQLTHDIGLKGVSVHFAWPSAAHPLAYVRDRGSALYSRDDLADLIRLLNVPEARRVGVIAHSMGAFLTMETLRQMDLAQAGTVNRLLDGVILMSPDIDLDVFRSQARHIDPMPRPFAVFLSQRDRALGLSARLTGERARLGNLSDADEIGDFDIAVVDVSEFSTGQGHFNAGTSPALIGLLARAAAVDNAFSRDAAGAAGILPGTVLTVRNVTTFILSPGGP